jgi:hypothetical protein
MSIEMRSLIAGVAIVPVEHDFPYFKDRILKMRDVDIHQNNVEAIWEKLGGK